jgi:hypothetical protein
MDMPLEIDRKTRRIFGYLAEWGTCHIGIEGLCTTPPPSDNDYAFFRKGRVETTEGPIRVGNLSVGRGHANPHWRNAVATEHYDKPEAVKAYVVTGENARGIWYSGVLTPWATDADIDLILGIGAFSGDWRDFGNPELDLMGVTCVNTPGFPVKATLAASGGRQTALIAAGNLYAKAHVARTVSKSMSLGLSPEEVAAVARTAVAEYRHQERVAARLEPARQRARALRLAAAKKRIEQRGA